MRVVAIEERGTTTGIGGVLWMAPGWVKTDLGGPGARLTVK
jgi:hypothetical protein